MIFKVFVRVDYSLWVSFLYDTSRMGFYKAYPTTYNVLKNKTFKITFKTLFFEISWYFKETNNLFNANATCKVVEFQIHIQSAISSFVQINLLKIISNLA